MVLEPYKSLRILGLGFRCEVNFGDPSNDCVSLRSRDNRGKASQEPQPSLEQPTTDNFFQLDFLASLTPARGHSTRITEACSPRRWKNIRQ